MFNTWKRRQWFYESRKNWKSTPKKSVRALFSGLGHWFWGLCGAGVHLGRFILAFTMMLLILSIVNFYFREPLGLKGIANFIDAFYFTVITLTTIGYGDITPSETAGRVMMAAGRVPRIFPIRVSRVNYFSEDSAMIQLRKNGVSVCVFGSARSYLVGLFE